MAISFGENGTQGEYVIFQYCGKTMMGKFFKNRPAEVSAAGGSHAVLGFDTNCYYVFNPAEIEFDLTIPSTGSADLKWKVKPIYYKDLIGDTNSLYLNVVATYPKSQVILTNIGGTTIDQTLRDAYSALCE